METNKLNEPQVINYLLIVLFLLISKGFYEHFKT